MIEELDLLPKTQEQCKIPETELLIVLPKISFFRCPVTNTQPNAEISLLDAYKVIKGNRYKARTAELRNITEVATASKYKRTNFDYVTFSGIFSKRSDSALLRHSGLLTLDFDHVSNLDDLKRTLLGDRYFDTELMFVSPSGDGLKWIIGIELMESTHQQWFASVSAYLKATYQLEVDKSGKDISRACFLPHDPEVYIHPDYRVPRFAIAEGLKGDWQQGSRDLQSRKDKNGDCNSPDHQNGDCKSPDPTL